MVGPEDDGARSFEVILTGVKETFPQRQGEFRKTFCQTTKTFTWSHEAARLTPVVGSPGISKT